MPHFSHDAPFSMRRRDWLAGAAAATTLVVIPWKFAGSAEPPPGQTGFMRLSQYLTGRATLDTAMGQRIYAALLGNNPQFPEQSQQLLRLIESRNLTTDSLAGALSSEKPELGPLPGQIMTAWYLGVVGTGVQARVLAFEHALNAQTVADQLKPPTYAYGAPGSWSLAPHRSS